MFSVLKYKKKLLEVATVQNKVKSRNIGRLGGLSSTEVTLAFIAYIFG